MGKFFMWNKQTEESWRFLWKIVSAAFTKHLTASAHNLKTLTASWDYVELNHDLHDLADKFFKLLFRRAPGLQKLFVKPRKMQFVMFLKAVDLIVNSVEDTTVLEVDLKAVAMRHIKFDIGPDALAAFGDCLIEVLADMLGAERWDEEVERAWRDMYNHVAQVFGHVISTGRNLVSKALASGDPAEVELALGTSARERRTLDALEIEVDCTVVSPIVWTIAEGQPRLTEALLKDLLTIRGDRENYYYGREMLWRKHPWIVQMLVEKAPKILPTFLDGHLWTSRFTEEGGQRVNYYIKELYGDPYVDQNANVYNTTLGVFVAKLPDSEMALYTHPCIDLVINLKWEQFARSDFIVSQLMDVASLVLFTAYVYLGASHPLTSFGLACAQVAVAMLRLLQYILLMIKQYHVGNNFRFQGLGVSFSVPYGMVDVFTLLNMLTCTFVLAAACFTYVANPFSWKEALDSRYAAVHADDLSWELGHSSRALEAWACLLSVTTVLLWLQQIEMFRLSNSTSALLFSLTSVLPEIGRFALVLGLLIIAYGTTLYWLKVGVNLEDGLEMHDAMRVYLSNGHTFTDEPWTVVYWVLMSTLGLTGIQFILESSWIFRIVYTICVVTAVVVMLNLLVSSMVSTYEKLQKSFLELADKSRAELVVRSEVGLSLSRRRHYFDKLSFDEAVLFDDGDDGPPGGIQRVVDSKLLTHRAFNTVDQVERYCGSSKGGDPWLAQDLISTAVDSTMRSGSRRKNGNDKLLSTISRDLERVATEIFHIKRGTQSEVGPSEGGESAIQDTEESSASLPEEGGTPPEDHSSGSSHAREGTVPRSPARDEAETPPLQPSSAQDNTTPPAVSVEEMKQHSSEDSLWLAVDGTVHDATMLLEIHPGGKTVLYAAAAAGDGDVTALFEQSHTGAARRVAQALLKAMPIVGKLES